MPQYPQFTTTHGKASCHAAELLQTEMAAELVMMSISKPQSCHVLPVRPENQDVDGISTLKQHVPSGYD